MGIDSDASLALARIEDCGTSLLLEVRPRVDVVIAGGGPCDSFVMHVGGVAVRCQPLIGEWKKYEDALCAVIREGQR